MKIEDAMAGAFGGDASTLRTISFGGAINLEAATWDQAGPVRLERFFEPGPTLDAAGRALFR